MQLQLPISESIDAAMLAAVQQVTVANGYQITLVNPVRWDEDNIPPATDLQTIVSWEADEPASDNDTPHDETPIGHQQWVRHYSVNVYLLKAPADPLTLPTWRNLVRAEIEKAVLIDRQRGTSTYVVAGESVSTVNAIDTYCRGMGLFNDATDLGGISVHFVVKYRTAENNPYLPDTDSL